MSIAPQIMEALDDVSPKTGEVQYGEYTNDTAPVIRVSLGDQVAAGELLRLSDNGQAIGTGVTITAAQIAQGYLDVPVMNLAEGWNLLSAAVTDAGGQTVATSMNFALGIATVTPASPTITSADDGTATPISDGGHTSDAAPTFHVFEPGLPPAPTSSPGHAPYGGPPMLDGHIQLYEGNQLVGDAMIGFDGTVTVASGTLSPGEHTLTAVAVDRAGNVSAPSAPFHLFIDAVAGASAASGDPPAGSSGGDLLQATAAAPMLHGGAGADTLLGTNIADVLFGGEGDDRIDTSASSGHNLVNGNLGADNIIGGSGGDTLHGGQGDDVIVGGSGADWISGDLGHNTLTGGQGADIFHAWRGYDLVTDFNAAQGDQVLIDHGLHYTTSQVGGDTVVDVSGKGQMVLAGVALSSLPSGWIVQA